MKMREFTALRLEDKSVFQEGGSDRIQYERVF
jgi:hypothetical protein